MKTATKTSKKRREATPEQKAAAQERREKIRKLWAQVAEMDDLTRARLTQQVGAIVTPEGRELSLNNTLLLLLQRSNATVCGGFDQWRAVGRCVRKGERALAIWVPISPRTSDAAAPAGVLALPAPREGTPSGEDVKRRPFVLGNVFDISQTEAIGTSSQQATAEPLAHISAVPQLTGPVMSPASFALSA